MTCNSCCKISLLVASATGNLGERIINSLLDKGAGVRVLVRSGSDIEKSNKLDKLGVKIFIDFTKFSPGENRNLDLRREFHKCLDKASISATSIFNGAFTDLLDVNH